MSADYADFQQIKMTCKRNDRAQRPPICVNLRTSVDDSFVLGTCMNSIVVPSGSRTYTTRLPAFGPVLSVCGLPAAFQPEACNPFEHGIEIFNEQRNMHEPNVARSKICAFAIRRREIFE